MGGFRSENREDVAFFYETEGCHLQECTGKNDSRLGWHLSLTEASQLFLNWFCHVNAAATSWGRQLGSPVSLLLRSRILERFSQLYLLDVKNARLACGAGRWFVAPLIANGEGFSSSVRGRRPRTMPTQQSACMPHSISILFV